MARTFTVVGPVELFPQAGGWHFVRVPTPISDELGHLAERGLVAVRATVGTTSWDTSLLPMGDGTTFLALNARVRRANGLALGDTVTVVVSPRPRERAPRDR